MNASNNFTTKLPTEKPEPRSWQVQSLDTVERLAIYIVGGIALQYPDISGAIAVLDRQATPFFWEEVASIIKLALPHMDLVELERMQKSLTATE